MSAALDDVGLCGRTAQNTRQDLQWMFELLVH